MLLQTWWMSWVSGSHLFKKSMSKKMGVCPSCFIIECDIVINLLPLCKILHTLCNFEIIFLRLTRVWCKNHWVEILSSGFLVSFLPRTVVKIAIFKSTLCILAKIAESHHGQNYQHWSRLQFVPAYYQRFLDAGLMLVQQINETDNYRRQPRRD